LKKGKLAKSEANEPLIVDENNKAYKAHQTIVTIWNMCDGNRTMEQIVDELATATKVDKRTINDDVSKVLAQLEQIGLVQKAK